MYDYISFLSEISLFDKINKKEIALMLKCLNAQCKNFDRDKFIRSEGDSADFMGIVLSGIIQLVHYDVHGNRNITASFYAGDLFAEALSCAEIKKLPFFIQAVTDCEILFLDTNRLLYACSENCEYHHKIIHNLIKIISQKNMLLNQKLYYMSQRTTSEKLRSFLNDCAKKSGSNEFTIPFDRQALADYLGVERSAMSAEISKLQKQGFLETRRNWFRLHL